MCYMTDKNTPLDLILSLFPGADGLGIGFEASGFCVVRGPDKILEGDVRNFHAPSGRFGGIVGGPPCVDYSGLNRNPGTYSDEMGDEMRRIILEAQPNWWLHENVKGSPLFEVPGYTSQRFELDLNWFKDAQRARVFTFGTRQGIILNPMKGTTQGSDHKCVIAGDDRPFEQCRDIQGFPDDFKYALFTEPGKRRLMGNAVPLEMSRYLGQLIAHHVYGRPEPEAGGGGVVWKRCKCGCGRAVYGRKSTASDACRVRHHRAKNKS